MFCQIVGVRQKHPLARCVGMCVDQRIDKLETKRRHANGVNIGKGKRKSNRSSPVDLNSTVFARQPGAHPRLQVYSHIYILRIKIHLCKHSGNIMEGGGVFGMEVYGIG